MKFLDNLSRSMQRARERLPSAAIVTGSRKRTRYLRIGFSFLLVTNIDGAYGSLFNEK